MSYKNTLECIKSIFDKLHIKNTVIPRIGIEKISLLDEVYDLNEWLRSRIEAVASRTVYSTTDILGCRYIFFLLPGDDRIMISGPYLTEDMTQQSIWELAEKLSLSSQHTKFLELFYATLPVINEENHIFAMINTLAEDMWGESFDSVDLEYTGYNAEEIKKVINASGDGIDIDTMEERYRYENELIAAISSGNIHKAELMMSGFSTLAYEDRVPDKLRNMKNYCIISNTLFRKAAEQGGVHPHDINRISSGYAKRIEEIRTLKGIYALMPEMVRGYCTLVRSRSVTGYSKACRMLF